MRKRKPKESPPDPRSPLSVRRSLLPWRRKVRNISDYDFMPGGMDSWSGDPISNAVAVLMFPLWLPAFIVFLVASVEFVLALPFLPFALLRRRLRGRWPVEVLDRRGRVLEHTDHPTWKAAGIHAAEVAAERSLQRWQ